MNSDGSNFNQIITGHHRDIPLGWSPDGRFLLLSSQANVDLDPKFLGIYDMLTGTYTAIADNISGEARWSPGGTRIAYIGHEPDSFYDKDIYVISPDGSGKLNLTHNLDNEDAEPVWSADSQWLVFSSRNDETQNDPNWNVYVIQADGSGLFQVTKNIQADRHPYWQP